MPAWVIPSTFAAIAITAAYGIWSSLATGRARDDLYSASADERPVLFMVLILAKLTVLVISVGVVLHALGLTATDPIAEMKHLLGGVDRDR